ncbi:MAG: hypothetical protein N3E50_03530 [Candidatus Goldbacteria bacterium]|nr:hypothetical protein [Candidatus Goldiibacteriota bacterium]
MNKKYLLILLCLLFLGCNKKNTIPFTPLMSNTPTATLTNTPIFTSTITPTITHTHTHSPTVSPTLDIYSTPTFTITPTITPPNSYGGINMEYARGITKANDGGYILVGTTRSIGSGESDIYILKIDENGYFQWKKIYGGAKSDVACDIIPSTIGGYIISGYTESYGAGLADGFLMKTDNAGNQIWFYTYGGADYDFLESVYEDSLNNIYAAGSTRSFGANNYDPYLLKVDPSGNILIQKNWLIAYINKLYSMSKTKDNNFIFAGESVYYYYLLKTDNDLNPLWQRTPTSSSYYSFFYSVTNSSDGGYITTGEQYISTNNYDLCVYKFDSAGNVIWNYNYGGALNDSGKKIIALSDGYIICGETLSFGNDAQAYIIRIDLNGNLLWQENYGGSNFDTAYCMTQSTDGGFIIGGMTASYGSGSPGDLFVFKINSLGQRIW